MANPSALGTLAMELRNQLTVVVGFSHELRQRTMSDPEQIMRAAARIEQAGWRSASLLKQIERLDSWPPNTSIDDCNELAEDGLACHRRV